ncbi:hypothetical protein [Nocardioides sp. NPDC127503]|uniref:hypothetical protein n=1 Tax=Nocardioides sp. NPDC127503 TaxID=3154516 RepID=UPI0033333CF2
MLNLQRVSEAYLEPVTRVVSEILRHDVDLAPSGIMIVGAFCRDIHHEALGHRTHLRPTNDLDVALAITGWDVYTNVTGHFRKVPSASNDIRYSIAGEPVDLLAFGDVENPTGSVTPPPRKEPLSVWGFEEIHRASLDLSLKPTMTIRLPSVPGYTAAKLMAWLDRSEYGEVKDAQDLALTTYWYAESREIEERLWANEGAEAEKEGFDVTLAAARLLGQDVATLIGEERLAELQDRWPGDERLLTKAFKPVETIPWTTDAGRTQEIIRALTRGLTEFN